MLAFAVTIFLSAFLLFQVQPLIGKFILPWFGGTPAVWTTCLLFFQVALLGGYAYAHLLASRLSSRAQGRLHIALLALAALALPIIPSESWKPGGEENPLPLILGLLAVTVGAPYLILSATGPLLQGWFSRLHHGVSPYRLYALSNVGSLLALLTYPILFERLLRLKAQGWTWSIGFLVFGLLCGLNAWHLARANPPAHRESEEAAPAAAPRPFDVALWLCLAACGSLMLLATTNQMCQDVAVVPFLWIVPLSLYLLTFIICFDREGWYQRPLWAGVLAVMLLLELAVMLTRVKYSIAQQIGVYSATLFVCCMVCHGEMVRLKPSPRYLTLFYLMVSAGGALGGLFVALFATWYFDGYWELHVGLMLTGLLLLMAALRDFARAYEAGAWQMRPRFSRALGILTGLLGLVGVLCLGSLLREQMAKTSANSIAAGRSFYGVLRVLDEYRDQPAERRLTLCHGQTRHGFQFTAPDKRAWPTAYFGPDAGVGIALLDHPRRNKGPLRIGVVGLGAGTLAVYGRSADTFRYYEINPMVETMAEQHFTFLADARRRGVDMDVLLGDARIVMEHQLRRHEPQRFDVLILDAFSSDAIPMHLLTREAFAIYRQHLADDGILVVQVTNWYVDLTPVVRQLADEQGWPCTLVVGEEKAPLGIYRSRWVVMSPNPVFMATPRLQAAGSPWPQGERRIVWTDDFSNLSQVIRKVQ
ncbi:MAG: fused MFS/spermidine synthase [Armatimonadetes bacterium]|nr:fused MFS/spermidine synthase [Armatimonadota bacterium]